MLTLTACGGTGERLDPPGFQPIPGDIIVCLGKIVGKPKAGPMSKREIAELIAELHKNDVAKTRCGKRLIDFYNNQSPK